MISKNEFLVLKILFDKQLSSKLSQRELSTISGLSLGTVNSCLKQLSISKLIDEAYQITSLGFETLDEYKVKRAIFFAAGFGERLIPLTLTTPKPLLKVKGKPIIEIFIEALHEKGIMEVIIVTGHLHQEFNYLQDKYKGIQLIYSGLYNQSKNISSAYLVKNFFSNAYIFEADLYLKNTDFIKSHFYQTMYNGTPVSISEKWCFKINRNIISDFTLGGEDVYEMAGVSYWNETDGLKLEKDITEVYNAPGGKERFWDEVPLIYKKENYSIELIECSKDDIEERNSL